MYPCTHLLKRSAALTRRGPLLLAALMLAGCVAVPFPQLPANVPGHWSHTPPDNAPVVALDAWWTALNDPRLDALVQEALAQNLDLARAQRLLEAERETAGRSTSAFLPSLSIQAYPTQDAGARNAYFNTSMDMLWELGLFGARESADMSATGELNLAQAHEQGARVLVVAEVVRNYLDLGVAQDQIARLERIDALDQQVGTLARSNLTARLGTNDAVDAVHLRRQSTLIELAELKTKADIATRSLALLLGRAGPDDAWREVPLPTLPATFSIKQIPADLLRTRPDIRAAEAQVLSAAGQVGLARAALYPRISLAGSILYTQSLSRNKHGATNLAPLVGPAIDIPLWDWGQRRAQAGANEHKLQAALLHYRKTVLAGVSEVQAALVSLAGQQQRTQALQAATTLHGQQAQRSDLLVTLGLDDDIQALEHRRTLLAAQASLKLAQGSQTLAFATLFKALGGAALEDVQKAAP